MDKQSLSYYQKLISQLFFVTFLICATITHTATAASDYSVQTLADLSKISASQQPWLIPIENRINKEQLIIANADNSIYVLNKTDGTVVETLKLSAKISHSPQAYLTAFTLHPSFATKEQRGSNLFYTAHVEPIDATVRAIRLTNKKMTDKFLYDAIVTEWTVENAHESAYHIVKQREVLRYSIIKHENHITQLGFNTNIKPWANDFGLMYISMKPSEALADIALFGGSVLRIDPFRLGLKNYTIPDSNPYLKNKAIHNEVIIVGAQKINALQWSKNNVNQLLLSHEYHNESLTTLATIGDNWLSKPPTELLYKGPQSSSPTSAIHYQGKLYPNLKNKLSYLLNNGSRWHLYSSDLTTFNKKSTKPQLIWNIPAEILSTKDNGQLFPINSNELVLFNISKAKLFTLTSSAVVNDIEETQINYSNNSNTNNTNKQTLTIVIITLIFAVAIIIRLKTRKHIKSKAILHSHYGALKLNVEEKNIEFYKRHRTSVDLAVPFKQLTGATLLINDQQSYVLSNDNDTPFSEQEEDKIKEQLIAQKRHKMAKTDIRKILITLQFKQQKDLKVCLYLREGNQRMTKGKYGEVSNDCINLFWALSNIIYSKSTPKRRIKVSHG